LRERSHLPQENPNKALIVQHDKREPIAYEEALFKLDVTH
jgi:hypothetical protein